MTLEEITNQVKAASGEMPQLGKSLKLVLEEGVVHIDLTGEQPKITNEDNKADCTVTTKIDTLQKMRSGDLNGMAAVMMGKVKIKGDMGLAMKLQSLLG